MSMDKPKKPLPQGMGVCACCGKRYGQRATNTQRSFVPDVPGSDNPPTLPYTGNGVVLKESYYPDDEHWRSGDRTHQATSNDNKLFTLENSVKGRTVARVTWIPGDYWKPYHPFCTLRCAEAFAHAAFKAGYRIKGIEVV